ncbi:MAG: cation diffusion facilitator family transporter [Clostridiaceae bacterium]
MKIYHTRGVHCIDCAKRLQYKLRNLENNDDALVDYGTHHLYLSDNVDMVEAKKIFAQENILVFPATTEEEETEKLEVENHGHGHDHTHHLYDPERSTKNIKIVFFINLIFSIMEFVFGVLFNSFAILSDAVHDLGDSISVGLAWFFQKYSQEEANSVFSFGHQRFSIMGAIITSIVLLTGSLIMLIRSIPLLLNPQKVNAEGMFVLSLFAIAMNGYAAWLLSRGRSKSESVLNLHMLEDVLGWIGVLIVSTVVRYTGWYILDPILSIGISLFIFIKALPHFIGAIKILLQAVPDNVDINRLRNDILEIEDVHAVSHLHIWSIDGEENAMTLTFFTTINDMAKIEEIKDEIKFLTKEISVAHITIEAILDIEKTIQHDPES